MTRPAMITDPLLTRRGDVQLALETMNADELKRAARFWVGKPATTMRKGGVHSGVD